MFGGTKTGGLKAGHLEMYHRMTNLTVTDLTFKMDVDCNKPAMNMSATGWASLIWWKCVCVYILRIARHSALRLVGQEPEPSQATDMVLACSFLGKVLGVGCHYFPPHLDMPTFATRYLHVCTTRGILVAKCGTMGKDIVR